MKPRIATVGAIFAGLTLLLPGVQAQTPAASEAAIVLTGAGATFPAPLYKKWIAAYRKVDPTVVLDYKAVGSGEGVKRFLADSVDFAASDAALSDEQIAAAPRGAVLVPATAGMIALVYNLPGLNGPLQLRRDTYAALLMGRIPRWNDARIQATNPGLNLPDREIVLVARLDSSGTTYALTNHLSAASTQWRDRGPGTGKIVRWPASTMLVRGNEGVAARVKLTVGSIGYVEFGFAKHLGMQVAHLENKDGRYVAPGVEVGKATLEANLARVPANLRVFIPDPDGADAYPIVSVSWLLLKERYTDQAKAQALKRFVNWALQEGQNMSSELGFIPLPGNLMVRSQTALGRIN